MQFKTLDDLPSDLAGKRALVRLDLNVPMRDGIVTDTTRLKAAVPTIALLADRGAKVLLLSHFGRPKGVPTAADSLVQVVPALSAVLGRSVGFLPDCVGAEVKDAVAQLADGAIVVLENTRFHAGETRNAPEFAAQLAKLGDLYVNDAFSVAHRAHVSTEGLAHLLPAYAGRSMEAELKALDSVLGDPARPLAAVVGGAKVSTKLDVLLNLVGKVDHLIIGGAMANTFLLAKGIAVGKSLCEAELTDTVNDILARADSSGCTVHLPWDVVVAKKLAAGVPSQVVNVHDVADDDLILDLGPHAVESLADALKTCATLIWNGPLGAFEIAPFDRATVSLAKTAAALTVAGGLVSVAGGGDTVAALNHAGAAAEFSFVSTAGGAFLEWMEGRPLPAVEALQTVALEQEYDQ